MTEKLIYLASPYSAGGHKVKIGRFEQAKKCAQWLLERGLLVFSPIAYSHQFAEAGMAGDFTAWKNFDELMIERCDELWVLMIPGVFDSKGVKAEIELAHSLFTPVHFIEPRDDGDYYEFISRVDGMPFYEKILKNGQ